MWLKPPYTVDLGSVSGFMTLLLIPKLDTGIRKLRAPEIGTVILTSSFEVGPVQYPHLQMKKQRYSEGRLVHANLVSWWWSVFFPPNFSVTKNFPESKNIDG